MGEKAVIHPPDFAKFEDNLDSVEDLTHRVRQIKVLKGEIEVFGMPEIVWCPGLEILRREREIYNRAPHE